MFLRNIRDKLVGSLYASKYNNHYKLFFHKIIMAPITKVNEKTSLNLDNIKVLQNQDFWTIENVNYRNKICKVDLLKTLLDNRNRKNQEGWIEFSKQAAENNGFYVGDMPLYHSIFSRLYELKN